MLILFIHNNRKIEKSIKPIPHRHRRNFIWEESTVEFERGVAEINAKLNKVAKTLQRRDRTGKTGSAVFHMTSRTHPINGAWLFQQLRGKPGFDTEQKEKIVAIRQQATKN